MTRHASDCRCWSCLDAENRIAPAPVGPYSAQPAPVAPDNWSEFDKLVEEVKSAFGLTPQQIRDAFNNDPDMDPNIAAFVGRLAEIAPPIPMVLYCPACGVQHIDASDTNYEGRMIWTNPPHRSHLCASCGHIWRPADVPTVGVEAIQTKGKNDSPEGLTLAERYDALSVKFSGLLDHATGGKLSVTGWALETMKAAVTEYMQGNTK